MKRTLLLLAVLIPFGAAAQSRAVERFASAWDGREGVSVVSIKANVVDMGKMGGVDISDFIRGISSMTIVSNEKPDERFARELEHLISEGDYVEFMSVSEGGEKVKILYRDMPRNQKEVVISVVSSAKSTLISAVGDIDFSRSN